MLSIVDDSSLACSVSARSDMLRRSSQTATGSPARTSSTSMMVMESLLAKKPLIRSLKAATRPGAVGARWGGSGGCGGVAAIAASLWSASALCQGRAGSVPFAAFASPCGTLSCERRNKSESACGRLRAPRHPPRRKSGADERLRAREIVDQLEALAAGRGVGDYPVTDFVRAVAGARQRIGEERREPRVLAVLEVLDAGVIELLVDPPHRRLADRVAQAAGAEHCHPQWFGVALDRLSEQPAPGEAAPDARHRLLEVVDDHRHDGQFGVDADAPERDASAVVELEAVRQRGLEIAVERGFEQMTPERGVALEALARKHLFHERLGRAVVLVADADADRRQVADEEVDPVIGRDDDKQVRTARLEPPPDLVEGGRQPVAVIARHRLPIPRDDRPVTGREHANEISHRPSLSRA